MKKTILIVLLSVVVVGYFVTKDQSSDKRFAVILQAGKESHEGMARAVHALLYSKELKENGYDVVLIFDGAGTEWAEEFNNPESKSRILSMYKDVQALGVTEIICDFCAGAFGVKDKLKVNLCPLVGEYQGHPSIVKWVKKGYRLVIL